MMRTTANHKWSLRRLTLALASTAAAWLIVSLAFSTLA